MLFRKAEKADIFDIVEIYDLIHGEEEAGRLKIGWVKDVYPTEEDALKALERDDLYVMETEGCVVACGIINRIQVDVYEGAPWKYPAEDKDVMVLHTLCVDPRCMRQHYGTHFVEFYEFHAREMGCSCLRLDTNVINFNARAMYMKLGYKEIAIVPCTFNGIDNVDLVLLEKHLE